MICYLKNYIYSLTKKLDNEKNKTFIINSMPFLRYSKTITPEIIQNSKVGKYFGVN